MCYLLIYTSVHREAIAGADPNSWPDHEPCHSNIQGRA